MESLMWPYNLWEDVLDGPLPGEPVAEDALSPTLYLQNLEPVISSAMKERYQKAIHMRYEQGMTYREIGEVIGTKSEGVRQIIVKALRILREPQNYFRLSAVPEIEVVRQRKEYKELARQHEELQQRFSKLFGKLEQENAKKRLQIPLDSPLDTLGISIRSQNALIARGILTVGELLNCSIADLKGFRHLGTTSLTNIVDALAKHGFELKAK
ncbi:MAG: DNA-directed RNA polymerase subunit alpha [Enterocloster aldenensis]